MHLSVLFHHKNGKITIKTDKSSKKMTNKIVVEKHAFISTPDRQSSVNHDYIQFIQQTPTIQ